jgi:hypothetical protein
VSYRLFPGNKWILVAFAVYGLIAGLVWVVDSESYEEDIFSKISIPMNFPTLISYLWILGENFLIPVPIPVWNAITVVWSAAVWTTIGFLAYHFYRWLKYVPPD